MKIACYIHPVPVPIGPNADYFWFTTLARLLQRMRRADATEGMLISRTWLHSFAKEQGALSLLEGVRIGVIEETSLWHRLRSIGVLPTALAPLAYGSGGENHPALQILADEVGRRSHGFEPDVVIAFGIQTDFLTQLWPKALRLHVETGAYTRNPYPRSLYFDHLGVYQHSAVGKVGKRLRAGTTSNDGRTLVSTFRAHFESALASIDPFRRHDLRSAYRGLILLPLQVSNHYSFDQQAGYRNQFELLFDVLSATPRDVGVIATEYLECEKVLKTRGFGENLNYLCHTFPNLIFRDDFRSWFTPSQFLVPRVDGVWTVSSNVGYQAMLFNRILGTPPTTHMAGIADATVFEDFIGRLGQPVNADAFLAWQLERYFVPELLFSDGHWLHNYLERRLDAVHRAGDPIDAFVPIADIDRLMEAWIAQAPKPLAAPFTVPRAGTDGLSQPTSYQVNVSFG
jgi:hypothetical protein